MTFTTLIPASIATIQLIPKRGGFCSYSPDDKKLVYNRVFREFRTWKRYRGGMADDIWIYDFGTRKTERIVENDAQDIIPMWHENKIYFLSETGETVAIKPGAKYEELARNNLDEVCQASIAVAPKQLLIRTATHLYCIQDRKP